MPVQMAGGEQQRVAIGVALANQPSVLLADEPTGELDGESADQVFASLRTANTELGVTIVVVTHDQQVSAQVRRTIAIRDGRISTEVLRRTTVDSGGQAADVAQEYSVLDFAVMVNGTREDAEALREGITGVLSGLGLRLSESKTRVVHLSEGFPFLGFRIQWHRKRGTDKWHV